MRAEPDRSLQLRIHLVSLFERVDALHSDEIAAAFPDTGERTVTDQPVRFGGDFRRERGSETPPFFPTRPARVWRNLLPTQRITDYNDKSCRNPRKPDRSSPPPFASSH